MSFTPRNVSQLLVANQTADQLTAVGDYQITSVFAKGVDASASGTYTPIGAKIMVKTVGGYKVSDTIYTADLDSYNNEALVPGAAKVVTLTVPADIAISTTYSVTIDVHDGIGSMLNDRFISAYVVVDAQNDFLNVGGIATEATQASIATELVAILTNQLKLQGQEFTVAEGVGAGEVVITQVVPVQRIGANDGIALPVDISGKAVGNVTEGNVYGGTFFANEVTQESVPDGLTQLKNIEWFNSGYDKDPYRNIGWPASFEADNNVTAAGVTATEAVGIFQFHKDRDATNVERQHRQLIVAGDGAAALYAAITLDVIVP